VRSCSKNGCEVRAEATITLRYGPREVVIVDLEHERDPNLLELCRPHADRLSPPIGWDLSDHRTEPADAG